MKRFCKEKLRRLINDFTEEENCHFGFSFYFHAIHFSKAMDFPWTRMDSCQSSIFFLLLLIPKIFILFSLKWASGEGVYYSKFFLCLAFSSHLSSFLFLFNSYKFSSCPLFFFAVLEQMLNLWNLVFSFADCCGGMPKKATMQVSVFDEKPWSWSMSRGRQIHRSWV